MWNVKTEKKNASPPHPGQLEQRRGTKKRQNQKEMEWRETKEEKEQLKQERELGRKKEGPWELQEHQQQNHWRKWWGGHGCSHREGFSNMQPWTDHSSFKPWKCGSRSRARSLNLETWTACTAFETEFLKLVAVGETKPGSAQLSNLGLSKKMRNISATQTSASLIWVLLQLSPYLSSDGAS